MADPYPLEPHIADNYHAIADDPADPRGWDDIADMADQNDARTLAAYARAQAAGAGDDVRPQHAVTSYRNTRSKGVGKEPDGVNEPPMSFDKVTPGTRYPDLQVGDVMPTSVDPTGTTGRRAKDVSQNPSTAAKQVQAHPEEPLADHPAAAGQTVKAPQTVEEAQQRYNTEPPSGR